MNQLKFLRVLIFILILIVFLTACTDTSNKNKQNSNAEISQDQNIDEKTDDFNDNKSESNSEDLFHSSSNKDKTDNVDSSDSGATELDSNDGSSGGNDNMEKQPDQAVPSIEPANPSIGNEDQQADSDSKAELTYKDYMAMSPSEQKAYYDSYENFTDFVAWHNAAKAKYDAENESIEIEDGKIDVGDIIDKID